MDQIIVKTITAYKACDKIFEDQTEAIKYKNRSNFQLLLENCDNRDISQMFSEDHEELMDYLKENKEIVIRFLEE